MKKKEKLKINNNLNFSNSEKIITPNFVIMNATQSNRPINLNPNNPISTDSWGCYNVYGASGYSNGHYYGQVNCYNPDNGLTVSIFWQV